MGVDYTTSLVYGAVIKMKRVPTKVTRYHEVTGEPYQKTVNDYEYVVGDTDIVFDRDAIPDELHDQLCDDQKMFLTDQNGYFGIRLATVDPAYGESAAINTAMLESAEREFGQLVADTFQDQHPTLRTTLLANGQLTLVGLAW